MSASTGPPMGPVWTPGYDVSAHTVPLVLGVLIGLQATLGVIFLVVACSATRRSKASPAATPNAVVPVAESTTTPAAVGAAAEVLGRRWHVGLLIANVIAEAGMLMVFASYHMSIDFVDNNAGVSREAFFDAGVDGIFGWEGALLLYAIYFFAAFVNFKTCCCGGGAAPGGAWNRDAEKPVDGAWCCTFLGIWLLCAAALFGFSFLLPEGKSEGHPLLMLVATPFRNLLGGGAAALVLNLSCTACLKLCCGTKQACISMPNMFKSVKPAADVLAKWDTMRRSGKTTVTLTCQCWHTETHTTGSGKNRSTTTVRVNTHRGVHVVDYSRVADASSDLATVLRTHGNRAGIFTIKCSRSMTAGDPESEAYLSNLRTWFKGQYRNRDVHMDYAETVDIAGCDLAMTAFGGQRRPLLLSFGWFLASTLLLQGWAYVMLFECLGLRVKAKAHKKIFFDPGIALPQTAAERAMGAMQVHAGGTPVARALIPGSSVKDLPYDVVGVSSTHRFPGCNMNNVKNHVVLDDSSIWYPEAADRERHIAVRFAFSCTLNALTYETKRWDNSGAPKTLVFMDYATKAILHTATGLPDAPKNTNTTHTVHFPQPIRLAAGQSLCIVGKKLHSKWFAFMSLRFDGEVAGTAGQRSDAPRMHPSVSSDVAVAIPYIAAPHPASSSAGAGAGRRSIAGDLAQLAELHKAGSLTDKEFAEAKASVLSSSAIGSTTTAAAAAASAGPSEEAKEAKKKDSNEYKLQVTTESKGE